MFPVGRTPITGSPEWRLQHGAIHSPDLQSRDPAQWRIGSYFRQGRSAASHSHRARDAGAIKCSQIADI